MLSKEKINELMDKLKGREKEVERYLNGNQSTGELKECDICHNKVKRLRKICKLMNPEQTKTVWIDACSECIGRIKEEQNENNKD